MSQQVGDNDDPIPQGHKLPPYWWRFLWHPLCLIAGWTLWHVSSSHPDDVGAWTRAIASGTDYTILKCADWYEARIRTEADRIAVMKTRQAVWERLGWLVRQDCREVLNLR